MSNPRKFSEKIALHTQKQAEETAAFRKIMEEVKVSTNKDDYVLPNNHFAVGGGVSAFSRQAPPEERNLLSPPQMPQRAESMPNVHEGSTEPERPRSSIDVRAALSNLALMRQGRDPSRHHSAAIGTGVGGQSPRMNRMPTPNGGPLRTSGSYSRGHSPIAPSAARVTARLVPGSSSGGVGLSVSGGANDGSVGGGPIIGSTALSRSQHNLMQCGVVGRHGSALHGARADCQPYLLSPPSLDSHWRRTNSDSALHQSAIQAEQYQQHQQQSGNWPAYSLQPAPPYSPPTYINGSSVNNSNGCNTGAFNEQNQYSHQTNLLQSQSVPVGGAVSPSSSSSQLNRPTPMPAGSIAFSNFAVNAHHQLQQNVRQVAANVNRAAIGSSPHAGSNLLSSGEVGGLGNGNSANSIGAFGGANTAHGLSVQPTLVASNECLSHIGSSPTGPFSSSSPSAAITAGPGGAFASGTTLSGNVNGGFLVANGLSSRFGGSHGVGLDLLGTGHHSMQNFGQQTQQQFSHAASPHQHFQQQNQDFGFFANQQQHERPRSCDLPQVGQRSQPSSAMSSQVGSQLSSPLSMQQSPLHSPPSYSSGLHSPGHVDFQQQQQQTSAQSAAVSNVSEMLYQMPLTSPPAYPGSVRQNGPNSVGSNDLSRPDSATLSSAGSPPQSLPLPPQSPQSQHPPSVSGGHSSIQACPSPTAQHLQMNSVQSPSEPVQDNDSTSFPLDLDGLDECFESLGDDQDATNSFAPLSSQSPSHQPNSLSMSNSDLFSPYHPNESEMDPILGTMMTGSPNSHLQHQTRMLEQQLQQFKMADQMQNGHMILLSNQDAQNYSDQKSASSNVSTQNVQPNAPQTPTAIPDIILTAPPPQVDSEAQRDSSADMNPTTELLNFDDLQFYSDFCREQGFSLDNS